ncbi:ChaN family lipoprotein [Geobacter sp.]|uniref:ChaN family lipoprotein n=1 Tax=Geobacter sp. TaxID=46610 RepID=UPI002628FA29|nr:ChaN family lipoprotein [Geobacter sp.]
MRRLAIGVALLLAGIFVVRSSLAHDLIVRVSDRREVTFGEMMTELRKSRVVYVGENHDEPAHHLLQLRIIRDLHGAGVPLAIGMEMFTAADQRELDRWVEGRVPLARFQKFYLRSWTLPWSLYGDILLFARDHRIPLVGLNVPRKVARKVAMTGFDSLTPEERRALPPSVTCDVNEAYLAMIRRSYADHDASGRSFKNFCEAQMLWNKAMAYHLVAFARKNPRMTMVVITGGGHAMRGGMPTEVEKEEPALKGTVVLPDPAMPLDTITPADADYLWISH